MTTVWQKQVLRARLPTAGDRSLITCYTDILSECSLPDMDSLLSQPFKPAVWNKSTKKQLLTRSSMRFLHDCEEYLLADCDLRLEKSIKQGSITIGDLKLTRQNLFRIRLLAGCAGLEQDAARFSHRNRGNAQRGDPSCKICGAEVEDAFHFIVIYPSLTQCRVATIASAPVSVTSNIRYSLESIGLTTYPQRFCIEFLHQLRRHRISLLHPATPSF